MQARNRLKRLHQAKLPRRPRTQAAFWMIKCANQSLHGGRYSVSAQLAKRRDSNIRQVVVIERSGQRRNRTVVLRFAEAVCGWPAHVLTLIVKRGDKGLQSSLSPDCQRMCGFKSNGSIIVNKPALKVGNHRIERDRGGQAGGNIFHA
jgi:hypothetical protein